MPNTIKKVLFAAGGTGGHLFPAQALAEKLVGQDAAIQPFFAAALLRENRYFDRKFPFFDIVSMTPFCGSAFKTFKSIFVLLKGIGQSCRLLSKEKPVLVVGFGSFHTFPLLCAAYLKRIPLVLFESNAMPGRVIRLFAKRARLTGVYFSQAKERLCGNVVEVDIPTSRKADPALSKEEARLQMGLDPDLPTLLVFGGSQGSQAINRALCGLLPLLKEQRLPFQLIHLTGHELVVVEVSSLCHRLGVPCYVKKFETCMPLLWQAADVAVCRSGAMTISELLHYEVPGILVPYPKAAEQHQLQNALFLQTQVGGAILTLERDLTPQTLLAAVQPLMSDLSELRQGLANAIARFKAGQKKGDLSFLIHQILEKL